MSNIAEFKQRLEGGARPNLYRVTVNFPMAIADNSAVEKLQFMCKAAQVPGVRAGIIETWYMGRSIKLAGDREFDDYSITVLNDTDWKIRTQFEKWMNIMNQFAENIGLSRPNDYMTDIVVEQLDRGGNTIATYTLVNCFPTDLSAIDLSFETTNTIEEFTVSLAYSYWQRPEAGIV